MATKKSTSSAAGRKSRKTIPAVTSQETSTASTQDWPLPAVEADTPVPVPAQGPAAQPAKVAAVKAKRSKAAPAAQPQVNPPPVKPRKKLVRDSFTMPMHDFELIDLLKQRALDFKRPAKKSELLRAGLHALAALTPAKLKQRLDGLAEVKTGRPRKLD